MDNIFPSVTKLLESSIQILEYSEVTQNQLDKTNIVLWDKRPLSIDREVYIEFREAIKKKPNKYYLKNETLAYHDFCLALICSVYYTLNHTVTVSIPSRTYTAAWRAIHVVSITSSDKVKKWINLYLHERTALGYCNALNISQDDSTVFMPFGNGRGQYTNVRDSHTITSLSVKEDISNISIISTTEQTNKDTNNGFVFQTSFAPDSHLYDLISAHNRHNNRFF